MCSCPHSYLSSKEGVNIAIKHILWHNNQTYLSKNQTYPLKKKKKKECKKNSLTQNIKNIRKKQDNYPPKNTGLQTIRTYGIQYGETLKQHKQTLRTKKEHHLKKS